MSKREFVRLIKNHRYETRPTRLAWKSVALSQRWKDQETERKRERESEEGDKSRVGYAKRVEQPI